MVLLGGFGMERGEVTGGWRKLRTEELHHLYFLSSRIRMIKSRRMRSAGLVAQMGKKRMHIGFGGKARRKEPTRKF
jgi:hypothetical protein